MIGISDAGELELGLLNLHESCWSYWEVAVT